MIIIKIKEGEKIDSALKRYKSKHFKTKVTKEIRDRKHFKKKSVKNREMLNKAIHLQDLKEKEKE